MILEEAGVGEDKINPVNFSADTVLFEDYKTASTYSLKEQRKIIREWAKSNLAGRSVYISDLKMTINFTYSGIKEAVNQPHKYILEKNQLIKSIESILPSATYIKSEGDKTGDLNFIYHYLRIMINDEESFIVLKVIKKEGKIIFYSIVDKIKK